jgi:polyphosphate kinase
MSVDTGGGAYPHFNRDWSWLAFNHRVLQEARDPNVPLLERLKFLAIYSSNLDEFFRVRVAQHRNLIRVGKKMKSRLEYSPKEVLKGILAQLKEQQIEFAAAFDDIVK